VSLMRGGCSSVCDDFTTCQDWGCAEKHLVQVSRFFIPLASHTQYHIIVHSHLDAYSELYNFELMFVSPRLSFLSYTSNESIMVTVRQHVPTQYQSMKLMIARQLSQFTDLPSVSDIRPHTHLGGMTRTAYTGSTYRAFRNDLREASIHGSTVQHCGRIATIRYEGLSTSTQQPRRTMIPHFTSVRRDRGAQPLRL
jgi:hypothetical protein